MSDYFVIVSSETNSYLRICTSNIASNSNYCGTLMIIFREIEHFSPQPYYGRCCRDCRQDILVPTNISNLLQHVYVFVLGGGLQRCSWPLSRRHAWACAVHRTVYCPAIMLLRQAQKRYYHNVYGIAMSLTWASYKFI